VLEALPGAFALICGLDEWNAGYDREAFSRWLEGAPHPLYESWRIPLAPGDVLCLEKTGIVHTVIGCTLEEFATISTDLVDRLHDQNAGDPIPASYRRERVLALLQELPAPPASRQIALPDHRRLPLEPHGFAGGEIVTLGEVPGLTASRLRLESGRQSPRFDSGDKALALFTSRADAHLLLGSPEETDPPALELPRGAATMIPPGMRYQLAALDREVELSLHAIQPDVALVEDRTAP